MAAIGFIATTASADEIVGRGRTKANTDSTNTVSSPPSLAPGVRSQLVEDVEGPDWFRANVPLNLLWAREGGDWSDVDGMPWGEHAFASCGVGAPGVQALTFDLLVMLPKLLADNTGIMLRSAGAMKLATSRSVGQPAPSLIVNGIARPLLADLFIDPSGGALGRLDWMQLPALLKFDLSGIAAPIESATLTVTLTNLYTSPPLSVGAFYLEMPYIVTDPAAQLGGVRQGIAATVARDQDLANHPSVVRYSELSSRDDVHDGSWFINPRGDIGGGHVSGDWTYDPEYIPWPEYGVTVGRVTIPGLPENANFDAAGTAMHRWTWVQPQPAHPWEHRIGEGDNELYVRYLLKIETDVWAGMNPAGGVKLPGFEGNYGEYYAIQNPDGSNFAPWPSAWSYRMEHGSPSPAHPHIFKPFVYTYDATNPTGSGSGVPAYLDDNICLLAEKVYSIEQYVRINTLNADGTWNADGIIRVWIDGVLALNITDRMITQVKNVQFYDVPFLNIFHGGTEPPDKTIHYQIGAVCVSHEYIGPARKLTQAPVVLPVKPPPKPPKPVGDRPGWAASAPLNTWIEIPGTRVDQVALPPNPTAVQYGYGQAWDLLSPWAGPSFQQAGAVLHTGPSGGHADGWSNHKIRTVLGVETPYSEVVAPASPGTDWVANACYYLDLKPAAMHTFYNHLFIDARGWDSVWIAAWMAKQSSGGMPEPPAGFAYGMVGIDSVPNDNKKKQSILCQIPAFDAASKRWLPPHTIADSPFYWGTNYATPTVVDPKTGDVYFGKAGSVQGAWCRWDCATNTHHMLPVASGPYNDSASGIDPEHNSLILTGTPAPSLKARLYDMTTGQGRDVQWQNPELENAIRTGQYPSLCRVGGEPGNFLYTRDGADGRCDFYKLVRLDDVRYRIDPWLTGNRPRNPVNGIFTKIHYSDRLGGYVFHNRWTENVKFMRII